MKRFLPFLGSGESSSERPADPSPSPSQTAPQTAPPAASSNLVVNLKNRFGRNNRNPAATTVDAAPALIASAAAALADSVQEIVSDTSSLKGDSIGGYQTLLDILDDRLFEDDSSSGRGAGPVTVLLQNLDHPRFVELCGQANLVAVLFQALRLLRMMEIKQSKNTSAPSAGKAGVTFNATCNVCNIMERLFSQSSTIEQVRQSLVKILTFPLGIFPCQGVHIQSLSAGIIFTMCRTGFTSQQIWFLHDVQAMSHMVRQLSELVAVSPDNKEQADSHDYLLRGLAAEREGMWITAIRCLVDVISAGGTISSVLMMDFDISGGSKVFLQILRTCSSDFFLQTLNAMMSLFTGGTKKPEEITSINFLSDFLLEILRLPRALTSNDTTDDFIAACHAIIDAFNGLFQREYILQSTSYSLLTIYSNDPANCASFESKFCFLPTLLIAIPTLKHTETIAAVLTTANYVCQCADYVSETTLRAICASCAVVVARAMNRQLNSATRLQAIQQLELLFSSVDAICRSSTFATEVILRNGFVKNIMSGPFDKLCADVLNGLSIDEIITTIFQRIVDIMIVLNLKSIKAADEIGKSEVNSQLRRIMGSHLVSAEFLATMLRLQIEFSRVDSNHLKESLDVILTFVREISDSWDKQIVLFDCLWRILMESDRSAAMYALEGGLSCSFLLIDKLKDVFTVPSLQIQSMAGAVESISRFLSLLVFLVNDDSIDAQFSISFSQRFVNTQIFNSPFRDRAITVLLGFITLFSSDPVYVHGPAVDVLAQILALVSDEIVVLFLQHLQLFLEKNATLHRQLLVEAGVVHRMLRTFSENKILKNEASIQTMRRFVSQLSHRGLTLESGSAIFRYLIRPRLRGSWQELSFDESNNASSRAVRDAFELYFEDNAQALVSPFGESPHFAIPVGEWSEASVLTLYFGESSVMFPSTEFTVSMWFKIGNDRADQNNVMIIPLMHFESSDNTDSVAFEFNLDSSDIIVTSCRDGVVVEEPAVFNFKFKSSLDLCATEWMHIVVSLKRSKRFGAATSVDLKLFVDGAQCKPVNKSTLTTECFSASNASGELRIGYVNVNGDNISAKVAPIALHIGSLMIFDSLLDVSQAAMLYLQGPQFLCLHPNTDSDGERLTSLARQSLRLSASISKNALQYLEEARLKGLESVVEPRLENHRDVLLKFAQPTLEVPQIVVNALASRQGMLSLSTVKNTDDGSYSLKLCPKTHSILNVAALESGSVVGALSSSGHVDRFSSFGTFIASVGGPDVLLPLLASARDEDSLGAALKLIVNALRQNTLCSSNNQQLAGLHAVAFLLHQLPRSALTPSTLELLVNFMAERPVESLKGGQERESWLINDTAAALMLVFNGRVLNLSNRSLIISLLKHIRDAVKDEKYGPANAMKFSAINTQRWLILLSLHLMEKLNKPSKASVQRGNRSSDNWAYRPRTAFEVADFRDENEEFFSLCTACLRYIVGSELRGKDLDLITNMIHFTFIVDTENSSPMRECAEPDNSNNNDGFFSSNGLPFCTYATASGLERAPRKLTVFEYFRVFLLRLLMTLFEDSLDESRRTPDARRTSVNSAKHVPQTSVQSNLQLFRQRCGPAWILSCLEQSKEVATTSHTLRLMGMFIQRDEEYSDDFCDYKGYQVLFHLLNSKTQEIPVVLPIIGLLFGIPMQMVLQPSQIKSVTQFSHLLDLEECVGPQTKSPFLENKTLPLLHIYYECLVNAERSGATKVVELLGGTLKYAFENNSSLRELMQNKVAVELHVSALLSCSNAFAEFGSKIFSEQLNFDLTSAIHDDYIRLSGTMKANPFDEEFRDLQNYQEATDRGELEITHGLGVYLRLSCKSMMVFALRPENENTKMLYHFLLAYNLGVFSPTYEHHFQTTMVELFQDAALECLNEANNDLRVFGTIARNLTQTIPLSKACFLYDVANFLLLNANLSLLRRLSELLNDNSFLLRAKHDLLVQVVQDLGNNARYLAFLCLHTGVYQYPRGGSLHQHSVLQCVRENMDILFQKHIEDNNDIFVAATGRYLGRGSMDDRTMPSTQVLEALQGLTSGPSANASQRKSMTNLTGQVRQDRNKLSAYFAVYLINYVYPLVLDDAPAMRTEAIRIIAFLSAKRRAIVEPVVSPSVGLTKTRSDAQTDSDVNIFTEGFMKLVPDAKGEYELTRRGGADDEESRFQDFSYWMSNHSLYCDTIFRGVEATLSALFPNFSSEADELNCVRAVLPKARDLWHLDHAEYSHGESERMKNGQFAAEKVARQLVGWRNDSVKGLTIGSLHWKQVLARLRSSPLWGYNIQLEDCTVDRKLASRTKISWCVDFCEGPEKTRRKLLQDVSPYNSALYGDAASDSNKIPPPVQSLDVNQKPQQNELETLLKQMNKRGFLRKASTLEMDGDLSELQLDDLSPMSMDADDSMLSAANEDDAEAEPPTRSREDSLVELDMSDAMMDDRNEEPSAQAISLSVEGKKRERSFLLREVIKGIIPIHDLRNALVYNVDRIVGLETQKAVLFLAPNGLHVLCGIAVDNTIQKFTDMVFSWVPINAHSSSSADGNKPASMDDLSDEEWLKLVWKDLFDADNAHFRFLTEDIYSFFKRRHELKYSALEVTDIKGSSVLFSCESTAKCDEVLSKLLERDLPSSIFNKMVGLKNLQLLRGATNVYHRLIAYFLSSLTVLWQQGQITNFEYLMHLNAAAGRSFLDLTQYPVFPWVLCDYASEDLDLDDPAVFRDLSKPMGALGRKRASQYLERYQTMDDFFREGVEGSSPPFHYGTHYSCAGYVLHYLLRLQPYANMSLVLQGGSFDKPDRLFSSIESSWSSASQENLQDVRELIPEFFYLPDFLVNLNGFDLGMTQRNQVVNDVKLPTWARNDPKEFIRIHRQALESKYVSENLHHWIDLIFGYKQRGKASIEAMNVFINITYEGEVDLDAIDDPVFRAATLSQINNFGQTPSKIFHKAHPRKFVPEVMRKGNDMVLVEPTAISWHAHLSPPLCVVGAPQFSLLNKILFAQAQYQGSTARLPVGDVHLISKERAVACPAGAVLMPPLFRKMIKFRSLLDGVVVQTLHTNAASRALEGEKDVTFHEQMHVRPITCVAVCKQGEFLATGSEDLSVRVWRMTKTQHSDRKITEVCVFSGHEDVVTCVDVCAEFRAVVSGSRDRFVCVWDYHHRVMVRMLSQHTSAVLSVSMNTINGNIVTLTKEQLRVYHLNGDLISVCTFADANLPVGKIAIAVPCGDWQNGVVAVSGHKEGHLFLWKLESARLSAYNRELTVACRPDKCHSSDITALSLCPANGAVQKSKTWIRKAYEDSRNLDLIVGDAEGNISRWTTARLDQLNQQGLFSLA